MSVKQSKTKQEVCWIWKNRLAGLGYAVLLLKNIFIFLLINLNYFIGPVECCPSLQSWQQPEVLWVWKTDICSKAPLFRWTKPFYVYTKQPIFSNLLNVVHLFKVEGIVERAEHGVVGAGKSSNARVSVVRTVLTFAVPVFRTFGHLGGVRAVRIVAAASLSLILDQESVLI